MNTHPQKIWIVGIVGPCGSGKTTLISAMQQETVHFRHIAQEHSYVPTMWKQLTNPDVLIFLDASYEVTCRRRHLNWTESEYSEQHHRLDHARKHADLYLMTDQLTPRNVQDLVGRFLREKGIL